MTTALMLQGAEAQPFWHVLLDNALALTVLVIFLAAAVGAVTGLRRKDKCLRLLHDHHVTFLTLSGRALWGDLFVYSQGLELHFDAPHTDRRGLVKSSALLYEAELGQSMAICRLDVALTETERALRVRQVRRSFRPGLLRRLWRGTRNIVNTLRDAIGQAVGTLVDAFAKTRGADVTKKGSPQLAESLTSAAKHAYDPMLEKHIGRPVVMRLQIPEREEPFEMPGYLVDYSDDWLAVFNVEHEHLREEVVTATDSIERGDLVVDLDDRHARISNPGREFLVVHAVRIGGVPHDLAVGLLPGCSLELSRGANDAVELELSWTRRFDVVCPRSVATVYFGADAPSGQRHPREGLPPALN